MNSYKELRVADIDTNKKDILFSGYQLTGAQLFIKNLFNPNTSYKTLLINWQTGVGKSIAAISIGNEFIKQFQERYILGDKKIRMVCVLGFTTTETIQADLLKYPEFGYVTEYEVKELNRLILENDPKQIQFSSMLSKRLSDKKLGSYYKFYGYREFVNKLFIITEKGLSNNISIQDLFNNSNESTGIFKNIDELIEKKYIYINNTLVYNLKNGIIIADEIHNVYNSLEPNNYGLAIQYILEILGNDAPRAVFMSATPLTGNASEVIDLINLLIPSLHLKRSDYFYRDSDGIYQLKSNTLSEIKKITLNKVSYLLDTDVNLYPTRIFLGDDIPNIPYIKINTCPLSQFHNQAIIHSNELIDDKPMKNYVLYDMVFPNPNSDEYGLYNDVIPQLQKSSNEWRLKVGIDIYNEENSTIITGPFLYQENIKKYSIKYYNLLTDILNLIKSKKQSKIMIYHHHVQLSGVLLLQELFKLNGFIDEISEPNNLTLCTVCGITFIDHEDNHEFQPCRFIMAHSRINKAVIKRNIIKFNDISNLNGSKIKLLIGSRIIREGLNFKAVRYQYITSLPINFPILIQVLGRVVRKNSHIDLPKDQQNVYIKIYASENELEKYQLKAKEYHVIQEVERALRINAVDNFIHYKKTTTDVDTLESLQFIPTNIEKPTIVNKYFDAYDYNIDEISTIKKLIYILFTKQNVWTYDDLWKQIHNVRINYNVDLIEKDNFDIALNECNNDIINCNNQYYIKTNDLDIECYYRDENINKNIDINLTAYFSKTSISKTFTNVMDSYKEKYVDNYIELSLIELSKEFHIELLKQLIIGKIKNDNAMSLYKRFKILITDGNNPIGFIDNLAVHIYDVKNNIWYNEPLEKYNIKRRYDENEYIIGYVENTKFKIREPITSTKYKDLRTIKKGMVCESHIREDLITIIKYFRTIDKNVKNYASDYDNSIIKPTISELCIIIKLYFLYFEEKSRSTINGMANSIRWLYLFNDNLPNIGYKN
jgi:hypothetical protein